MTDELATLGDGNGGLCLKPVLNIEGDFLVPGYPRGYRWGRPKGGPQVALRNAGAVLYGLPWLPL